MFKLTALGDEISPDIVREMDVLDEQGIRYVELRGAKGQCITTLRRNQLEAIHKKLTERGFRVSAIASPIGKIRVDEDFDAHLRTLQKVQDAAEVLGTRHIRVFSFYPDPGGNLLNRRDDVLERMSALVDCARSRNQVLLVENTKRVYGESPERSLDILQSVRSPHLRACFDFGNFVEAGVRPFTEAYPLLKDYIDYVQVKDAQKLPDGTCRIVAAGQGDGQVREVLTDLAGQDRDIFLSVEPRGTTQLTAVPGGVAQRPCTEAIRAVKRILDEIARVRETVTHLSP